MIHPVRDMSIRGETNDSNYRRKWDGWQSSAGESSAKRRKASRNVPFQRRGGKGPAGTEAIVADFSNRGEPCGGAARCGERLPGVLADSGLVQLEGNAIEASEAVGVRGSC